MLLQTPFHARTASLCQGRNWRRWAGYVAAGSYELTHDREYHAIRSTAALIDVSPLYKYRLRGWGAPALADRVITRDVTKLEPGTIYYTSWCDDAGKVRDDGTLQRLADPDLRLTSAEPTLRWLHENAAGLEVEIEDETDRVGALALQGPASCEILDGIAETDVSSLGFFRVVHTRVAGIPVELSRTGYTGDLGYEIWVDAGDALALWDAITEAGIPFGLAPAGLVALDVARVEAGLLLVDVDYVPAHRALIEARKSSPYELGLGWTVARDKANHVGRAALAAEREREPEWRLRGLEVDWPSVERVFAEAGLPPEVPAVALRDSVPVYAGAEQVGYATSRTWSPTVKKLIGLAHLRGPWSSPETELEIEITVEHRRRRALARVVRTPFFDPERKRAIPPRAVPPRAVPSGAGASRAVPPRAGASGGRGSTASGDRT